MATTDVVMYDEEFNQIKTILSKLRTDANAKLVFLVDKNGQQIAAHGNIDNLDTTSLASLTAGNIAATDALAKLIGEKEFSVLFHEGERDNIQLSLVGQRTLLTILFDDRTTVGMVRLYANETAKKLGEIYKAVLARDPSEAPELGSDYGQDAKKQLDNLFD